MANPIVHFEIAGGKGTRLQKFYGDVFGWKIDANNPMKYGVADTKGEGAVGINGGIMAAAPPMGSYVTVYAGVKSVSQHLKKVQKSGGKVVVPKTVIPGMVTFALFSDPGGNVVGIVEDVTPAAAKPAKKRAAKKSPAKKKRATKKSPAKKKRTTKKRATKKSPAKKKRATKKRR